MPGKDTSLLIQVLFLGSIDGLFECFSVAKRLRTVRAIQLTMKAYAYWTLIDITQQSRSNLGAIHDQKVIKGKANSDYTISKNEGKYRWSKACSGRQ